MSFLKIKDQNKRDETVKEFLDLKNRIKDNFRKERIGEIETQSDLSKFFKPITEMQKATAKEITEQLKPIKEGIEGAQQQAITFPAFPSIELPPEDIFQLGSTAVSSLKQFFTKEGADKTYGIYDDKGKFYIGNKEAEIKDNNIIVDGEEYKGTPGLWELIVSKKPGANKYKKEDYENYAKLMVKTNALHVDNNPKNKKPKSSRADKWIQILSPIWYEEKAKQELSKQEIQELRKQEKKERKAERKKTKTTGKGVVVVIPKDPNALLERLDLLLSSQEAGHTGVGNELVSICDELKRQGVIDVDTYKKLNSYIKI